VSELGVRPTLVIADDDPVIRSAHGMALERRFEIVGVAGDGDQAIAETIARRPDAVIIDVDMPGGGGARAVRGIAQACPETAMVVLSGDEVNSTVVDLLAAGAMTYCRKGIAPHTLADVIDRSIRAHRNGHSSTPSEA
jgi:two-component system nitrate/nitrite response regulator NarL